MLVALVTLAATARVADAAANSAPSLRASLEPQIVTNAAATPVGEWAITAPALSKAGSTFHSAQMVVEPGKQGGGKLFGDIVTRFERGSFENIYIYDLLENANSSNGLPGSSTSGTEVTISTLERGPGNCITTELQYITLTGTVAADGESMSGTYQSGFVKDEYVNSECIEQISPNGKESGVWSATRDGAPTEPTVSIGEATVAEPPSGTSIMDFPLTLSAPAASTVTVEYETHDGTGPNAATAPRDYESTDGTATLLAGETSEVVPVTVNHNEFTGKRTFNVTLKNPSGATISGATATGTINALRKPTVAVQCTKATGGALSCSVRVSDGSGTPITPTGAVSFSASAGTLESSECNLVAGTTGEGTCSVRYVPAAPIAGGRPVKITATYPGDASFEAGSGSFAVCADGSLLELDSVSTSAPHPNGYELLTPVTLHGCGFAAGMTFEWGVGAEIEPLGANAIGVNGTEANVTVPANATSGSVVVKVDGESATLAAQPVNSWRNIDGLRYENFAARVGAQEFVDAFAGTPVSEGTLPNGQPRILAAYEDDFEKYAGYTGGLCFGFADVTAALANGSRSVGEFGGVGTPYEIAESSTLDQVIRTDFLKQFSAENNPSQFRRLLNSNGADIRAQLEEAFGGDGYRKPAIVGINWLDAATKTWHGHAITAFGINSPASNPGTFEILTYNSNSPFAPEEDTSASLHRTALDNSAISVLGNGSWFFPELEAQGTAKEIMVTPVALLQGRLHLLDSGITNNVEPSTRVVTLTAPGSSSPVDLATGGSGGVEINPVTDQTHLPTGTPGPGYGGIKSIDGPSGRWSETVSNSSGTVGDSFSAPGATGSLKAGAGEDSVMFDPTKNLISVAPIAGASPSRAGSLTFVSKTKGTSERIATITGPVVSAHAGISLTPSGVTVSAHGGATFDVRLSVEGGGAPWQTFDAGPIHLEPGATLRLVPSSWSRLAGAHLTTLATGRHGRRALLLHNHFHAPTATVRDVSIKHLSHASTLDVSLSTPPTAQAGAVLVSVTVRHRGHLLARGHAALTLGATRRGSATITLADAIPRGATAQFTVLTEVTGMTPSSATARRTIVLRG